jgi:hypothetical protein
VNLIFFGLTTASFSIDYENEDPDELSSGFPKFGKSKENIWSPQVVLAPSITREGLPVN